MKLKNFPVKKIVKFIEVLNISNMPYPFKLVSREFKEDDTIVKINSVENSFPFEKH